MSATRVKSLFGRLSPDSKVLALETLAHKLTVSARATYSDGDEPSEAIKHLSAYNEMQHIITGQLLKMLDRDTRRYSDDAVIEPDQKVFDGAKRRSMR